MTKVDIPKITFLEHVPTVHYYAPVLQAQSGFDVEIHKVALAISHKGKQPPVSVALETFHHILIV